MKKIVLICALCLVFFGCGKFPLNENKNIINNSNKVKLDGGYFIKDNKVFYKRAWFEDSFELVEADLETFKVIYKDSYRRSYAKDKNNVYNREDIINEADPKTFKILEYDGIDYVAKDKNRIFLLDEGGYYPDEELNVSKFRPIGYEYFTDDKNIWLMDLNSDGDFIFMLGEDEEWKVDLETFEVLGEGYAKDKVRVFSSGSVFMNADPETFKILEHPYLKDKNNCYDLSGERVEWINGKSKYHAAEIVSMSECNNLTK